MDYDETISLLTLVKGNWYKQPTDDVTATVWQRQSKDLSLDDCERALDRIVRDQHPHEPPSCGEIFAVARVMQGERMDRENTHRRITGPERQWPPGMHVWVPVMSAKDGRILRQEERVADESGFLRKIEHEEPPEQFQGLHSMKDVAALLKQIGKRI